MRVCVCVQVCVPVCVCVCVLDFRAAVNDRLLCLCHIIFFLNKNNNTCQPMLVT